MSKDALQLRAEQNLPIMQAVIKRLDPHAIARQHQAALRLDPKRNREHSSQSLEAGVAPAKKGVQNHLSVTARMETEAGLLKLGA